MLTSDDVIRRAGVQHLPEYEDLGPMTDSAGFYVYRAYPLDSALAKVHTTDGRPAIRCLIQFVMEAPKGNGTVSRLLLTVRLSRRWNPGRLAVSPGDVDQYDPATPDAPTSASFALLKRAARPLDIDFRDEYTYDHREDVFIDDAGRLVGPEEILASVFQTHCHTYRWSFRVRWQIGSGIRWLVHRVVWRGQDFSMWLLLNFYDVELVDPKLRSPFHKYQVDEFRRITEPAGERSHFFGFQSSRKSLFTNLVIVAIACTLIYLKAPHTGVIRAVYNNTALTTAALAFAFLFADLVGPALLIRLICLLSLLRVPTAFFTRKVKV